MGKPHPQPLNDLPPPPYEQAIATGSSSSAPIPPPTTTTDYDYTSPIPSGHACLSIHADTRASNQVTLHPDLSADASALHALLTRQADVPDRPTLTVRGVAHRQSLREPRAQTPQFQRSFLA